MCFTNQARVDFESDFLWGAPCSLNTADERHNDLAIAVDHLLGQGCPFGSRPRGCELCRPTYHSEQRSGRRFPDRYIQHVALSYHRSHWTPFTKAFRERDLIISGHDVASDCIVYVNNGNASVGGRRTLGGTRDLSGRWPGARQDCTSS